MTSPRSDPPDRSSENGNEPGCCKSLFCCFPVGRRRRSSNGRPDDNNGPDYDYVVEKLLVKRVPVAIVTIGQDRPRDQPATTETASSSSGVVRSSKPTIGTPGWTKSEARVASDPGNESFDSVKSRQQNVCLSGRYEEYVKQQIKGMGLLNTLTAYHPDLKEAERPPKAPERKTKNGDPSFGWNRSNETGNVEVPETGRKLIVSPLQVEYKPLSTIDTAERRNYPDSFDKAECKNYPDSFDKAECKNYPDSSGDDRNVSTVLRWRITIKHQRDTESGSNGPKMDKHRFSPIQPE